MRNPGIFIRLIVLGPAFASSCDTGDLAGSGFRHAQTTLPGVGSTDFRTIANHPGFPYTRTI